MAACNGASHVLVHRRDIQGVQADRHESRRRSRRDADLAAAKHRDTQVSGMIDDVGRVYRWR